MSYPISATAIVSDAPNGTHPQWRKAQVQLREPGEDELLVRIIASGVCHAEIALSTFPENIPGFEPYPKIMGHEGDKVLLSFDYCGKAECRACEDETPGYCNEFHVKNLFNVPESSFSSTALVSGTSALNVEQLVKDEEELKLFAPMGCGYQTGAAAVAELAEIGKKDAVVVFGLGGVGMSAVMAANVRGAKTIIGVDRDVTADLPTAVREIVPMDANAIFDTTGVVPLIAGAVKALHSRGQITLIGIVDGKTMDLDLGQLLNFATAIRGCIEGNAKPSKFVPQMIEWYRQGKFPIEKLAKFYPADDFEKALADMHSGSTIKPILLW
ncbi:NAD(P)-binding protein [Lizonia empirigonia]|nr:NAD(P)-binding protein [Lizonia empirigonia]